MRKILALLLSAILCCSVSGCAFFAPEEYDAQKEIFHTYGRDGDRYVFSDAATLWIDAHAEKEFIYGFDGVIRYDDSLNDGMLTGKFDLWAWHDFQVFVILDGWFYVYDIRAERLQKYTERELAAAYPDYQGYGWNISGWAKRTKAAREKYPHLMGGR
nr:hypothetical protein [uncultured Ruminococcus sp.]